MKRYYPKQLENGNWAIHTGVKNVAYYPSTENADEKEVQRACYQQMMNDRFAALESIYLEAVELGLMEEHQMMEYLC